MKKKLPVMYVLLAAILWGTTGTTQAFAPVNTDPVAFGAIRLVIGGLTLFLFVSLQGKLTITNLPWKFVLIAVLCMTFYQPLFFSAVKSTGIAVGTVVAIGSAPVIAGVIEWILVKKKPTTKWWVATIIAITGCLLLFINSSSVSIKGNGILLALGAGLSFAIYTLVNKQLVKNHLSDAIVAIVFTLSGVCLLPVLFFYDLSWLLEKNGFVSSIYIGVIATAAAYFLFSKGLVNVNASTAVTLSLAEPLTATLLGVFIIGEGLNWISWLGVGSILFALVVLTNTTTNTRVIREQNVERNI